MTHVRIVDQTIRDGQQSLWGMRMQAGMCLPVAPLMDRAGYAVVDLVGSSMFEVMVRHAREDPWEGLDLIVQAMPRTPIRGGLRAHGIISMSVTPEALMDLWVKRLCVHGVRSFWIHDTLHADRNIAKMHRRAKVAKEFDAEIVLGLMYCLSPVHTDAYYAERAEAMAASPDVDSLMIYDMAGLLVPERARTLVPAVKAVTDRLGKGLEIHSHNVTGLAPLVYLEAIAQGVEVIHTASRPMANGASMPSVEMTLNNLRHAGHSHGIDEAVLAPIADRFEAVARAAGFQLGVPNEYDLGVYRHQIPGGMTGTFRNELKEHGMDHRLPELLEEVARVREELGYPGLATPYSQLVGTLALMNVLNGTRYASIPDEVLHYAYGWFGAPPVPIDPEVMDRIDAHPRARDIRGSSPPDPGLEEIRAEFGAIDDDELILRALVAAPHIDAMKRSGPVARDYPLVRDPVLARVRDLLAESRAAHVSLSGTDFSLTLSRKEPA
ncbi:MAG: hypothetical protein RIB84_17510 [Sneathiellaceae bacterium]